MAFEKKQLTIIINVIFIIAGLPIAILMAYFGRKYFKILTFLFIIGSIISFSQSIFKIMSIYIFIGYGISILLAFISLFIQNIRYLLFIICMVLNISTPLIHHHPLYFLISLFIFISLLSILVLLDKFNNIIILTSIQGSILISYLFWLLIIIIFQNEFGAILATFLALISFCILIVTSMKFQFKNTNKNECDETYYKNK